VTVLGKINKKKLMKKIIEEETLLTCKRKKITVISPYFFFFLTVFFFVFFAGIAISPPFRLLIVDITYMIKNVLFKKICNFFLKKKIWR